MNFIKEEAQQLAQDKGHSPLSPSFEEKKTYENK